MWSLFQPRGDRHTDSNDASIEHIDPSKLPQHVAIIMDGNGRWAKKKGWARVNGHSQGATTAKNMVEASRKLGIKYLTLYAFSEENWKRPSREIKALMQLLKQFIRSETPLMVKNGIRFCVIGNIKKLPDEVQEVLWEAKQKTQFNQKMTLTLALSYGGRDEIVRACQKILQKALNSELKAEDLSEQMLAQHLDTHFMPDPDLIIRTSGEFRVSNFLPWQSAYSELYVTPTLWPDFDAEAFAQAIFNYQQRERRFGDIQASTPKLGEITGQQKEHEKD